MVDISAYTLNMHGKKIKTTLVFQGGGATGISHVGALRAIEEANRSDDLPIFSIDGVAGTSIGGLMAALVCVGYESNELIDPEGRLPLCREYETYIPTGLVGFLPWQFIRILRFFYRCLLVDGYEQHRRFLTLFVATSTIASGLAWLYFGRYFIVNLSLYFMFAFTVLFVFVVVALGGVANFDRFERILGDILADRFCRGVSPEKAAEVRAEGLRFRHLADAGKKLRLIATNPIDHSIKVFSEELTPEVSVARAVTASMAIPILMRPVRIDGHDYWDGALVSNVPAWTFDAERTIDPDMLTLVFRVTPPVINRATEIDLQRIANRIKSVGRLFTISLFTAPQLEVKRSNRNFTVAVPLGGVNLLDFDLSRSQIQTAVTESEKFVKENIDKKFRDIPRIFAPVFDGISGYFGDLHGFYNRGKPAPLVRVYLSRRMSSHKALKTRFCSEAPDMASEFVGDRLIFPGSSFPAVVADNGRPDITTESSGPYLPRDFRRDRYRRRLWWADAKWCLVVPIGLDPGARIEDVIVVEADRPIAEFGLPAAIAPEWDGPLSFIEGVTTLALREEREVLRLPA